MTTQPRAAGEREGTDAEKAPDQAQRESNLSLGDQAVIAFRRDLAALLKERPGQWVAYHGDHRVGFARTRTELYQLCAQLRIPDDEFIVCPVEPEPPDEIYIPYPIG